MATSRGARGGWSELERPVRPRTHGHRGGSIDDILATPFSAGRRGRPAGHGLRRGSESVTNRCTARIGGSGKRGTAGGGADICTNPPKAEGQTLTFASYGGAYQEAQRKGWLEPYAALTGVTFQESEDSSNATIKAQVEAGQVTWDIVDVGNDFGLDAQGRHPRAARLHEDPQGRDPRPASPAPIASPTSPTASSWPTTPTRSAGQVPEGWADFFDTTKFPGKRGMWDYSAGGIFEFALLADGVAPADLYPLDLDRATTKLDTIKDDHRLLGFGRRVAGAPRQGRGRDGA